jgi:hypothetical protein
MTARTKMSQDETRREVEPDFARAYAGKGNPPEQQRDLLKHLIRESMKAVYGTSWVTNDVRERVAEAAALEYDAYDRHLSAVAHNVLLEMNPDPDDELWEVPSYPASASAPVGSLTLTPDEGEAIAEAYKALGGVGNRHARVLRTLKGRMIAKQIAEEDAGILAALQRAERAEASGECRYCEKSIAHMPDDCATGEGRGEENEPLFKGPAMDGEVGPFTALPAVPGSTMTETRN